MRASEAEFSASVELRATVSRSEDPEKVLKAMKNVLGGGEYRVSSGEDSIVITSTNRRSLVKMRDQLRDRRVRGAARRLLMTSMQGKKASVLLNRQAAFQGIVALCGSVEESPLGPIYLTLESDDLEALIAWLTAYPGMG